MEDSDGTVREKTEIETQTEKVANEDKETTITKEELKELAEQADMEIKVIDIFHTILVKM